MLNMVPTGRTVLSPSEQAHVPDKLLDFNFTFLTMYAYSEVLKKDLKKWSMHSKKGSYNYKDVLEMLWCGMYSVDNPESTPSMDEIGRMFTPRQGVYVNTMILRVIEQSSPVMDEKQIKKLEKVMSDPNSQKSP